MGLNLERRVARKGDIELLKRARLRTLGRIATAILGSAIALPGSAAPVAAGVLMHPTVSDYVQISTSTTPPTEAQCFAATPPPTHRRCFTPQAIRAAYNVSPLYAAGFDGHGVTIAIVDSYGSDTIAHDLHVFNQAFGLQKMCGEEGVTCAAGMPTFSQLHLQGSPATKPQPGKGTGQEDKSAWALEVSLDVETAHAMAPGANILLVTTPTAETLGVQGFPDMMNAEQYVVDHHLATVISQSFASTEEAFGSSASLMHLRQGQLVPAHLERPGGQRAVAAPGPRDLVLELLPAADREVQHLDQREPGGRWQASVAHPVVAVLDDHVRECPMRGVGLQLAPDEVLRAGFANDHS